MPSNAILEKKKQIVAELAEQIKASSAGVLVKYQGITVADDTKMRKALREAGVNYMVMKNSLTERACEEVGYGAMKQHLNGMTAIAVGTTDPLAPAKILKQYADKVATFEILAGYIDGAVISSDEVNALAEIPSKEVLVAKFLGSIQSPLYGFAYAIKAITEKMGGSVDSAETPAEA